MRAQDFLKTKNMVLKKKTVKQTKSMRNARTCLQTSAITRAMSKAVLVAISALFALDSPRRLPIRTAVAILKAKGAWNVVEADTRRTDWEARATEPNLDQPSARRSTILKDELTS